MAGSIREDSPNPCKLRRMYVKLTIMMIICSEQSYYKELLIVDPFLNYLTIFCTSFGLGIFKYQPIKNDLS